MNPQMYNWNVALLGSCDGSLWTGSRESPIIYKNETLHFRGKQIMHATISELLTKHGLRTATEVVVGGFSTGGHAIYLHCDTWAARIHAEGNAGARVVCFAEAGFFIDFDGWRQWHSRMLE